MFVLVRHAFAGDKHAWERPDIERPITGSGPGQAAHLVETLAGMDLRRLVSSPYLRCRQTLEPLAVATGLAVTGSDGLAPGAVATDVEALVADVAAEGTVFCTHGETLTTLFEHWDRHKRLARALRPSRTPKGAAWIVTPVTGGRFRLHYVPPLRTRSRS